jgi:hypothetical protein
LGKINSNTLNPEVKFDGTKLVLIKNCWDDEETRIPQIYDVKFVKSDDNAFEGKV